VSDDQHLPPELEELDRRLRGVRFSLRASFGPELLGRLRRDERPKHAVSPGRRGPMLAVAASIALIAGGFLLASNRRTVLIDRCCFDLDGGGEADDGVALIAERDAKVHRLRLYEDRDRSRDLSPADVIRLDRGDTPVLLTAAAADLVTKQHCCLDFDGGGPSDDGLLVIGIPPDRVVMAAIYERRPGQRGNPTAGAYLLR
jgi:hypothetical protein